MTVIAGSTVMSIFVKTLTSHLYYYRNRVFIFASSLFFTHSTKRNLIKCLFHRLLLSGYLASFPEHLPKKVELQHWYNQKRPVLPENRRESPNVTVRYKQERTFSTRNSSKFAENCIFLSFFEPKIKNKKMPLLIKGSKVKIRFRLYS